MLYQELAELFKQLESTTKRLEKTKILSEFLKKLSGEDKDVMYLLIGRIYPEGNEKEIGISTQIAIKAISKFTGAAESKVLEMWKKIGDLGKVAEELSNKKKQTTLKFTSKLTIQKVLENLRKLPELEGKGTVSLKLLLITELLSSASSLEAKYLTRTLIGDLRIGIKSSTIREALASAFFSEDEKKQASEKIQNAYDKLSDLAIIFELSKKGIEQLEKVSLKTDKPIKVMLAQKALSIEDGFEKCGKYLAAEYKYDGFRMLINKKDDSVSLYTRRLENVTKQFPDIVEVIKKNIKAKSCIIDSEIIGYSPKTKKYMPFQAISQRIRRKYDIDRLVKELPVEVKAFDIVLYNDEDLINSPFEQRSKLLKKIIKSEKYKITTSDQIITDKVSEVREFYEKAIKNNQEGLILKNLNAPYKPGSRVGYMLKLKEELRDFDLVITGAEYGTGKRAGWFSSFILSCKGNKKDEYLEIGKVGTGINEKENEGKITFKELTKQLKLLIIDEKGTVVQVKPKMIVAVTYQEIQKSTNYSSGYALRFPRVNVLRPDKPLSEITDIKEVENAYREQKKR
ncbi:MAG TPA: ATP-dependent DNA ligase, partial [Candidatus Nanoarchaeia archaeon]|nr:ATP-dependent DNA ligase [Candidatus Nanoarchaeia archaeon]